MLNLPGSIKELASGALINERMSELLCLDDSGIRYMRLR